VQTEEGAAFGAALLAGVGAGNWKSVDEAGDAAVRTKEVIQPELRNSAILDQAYRAYRRIYPALQQILDSKPSTADQSLLATQG